MCISPLIRTPYDAHGMIIHSNYPPYVPPATAVPCNTNSTMQRCVPQSLKRDARRDNAFLNRKRKRKKESDNMS